MSLSTKLKHARKRWKQRANTPLPKHANETLSMSGGVKNSQARIETRPNLVRGGENSGYRGDQDSPVYANLAGVVSGPLTP